MLSTDIIAFFTVVTFVMFAMHLHDNSVPERNRNIDATCVSTDTVFRVLDSASHMSPMFEFEYEIILTRDMYKKVFLTPACLEKHVRPIPEAIYYVVMYYAVMYYVVWFLSSFSGGIVFPETVPWKRAPGARLVVRHGRALETMVIISEEGEEEAVNQLSRELNEQQRRDDAFYDYQHENCEFGCDTSEILEINNRNRYAGPQPAWGGRFMQHHVKEEIYAMDATIGCYFTHMLCENKHDNVWAKLFDDGAPVHISLAPLCVFQ